MGGRIWVESTSGKGSVFHFAIKFGRTGDGIARTLTPAQDLRGKRILVVDDNQVVRDTLKSTLEGMTFATGTADSGMEAIKELIHACVNGSPYDLVFMDWMMPGLNGNETTRKIREGGIRTPAPYPKPRRKPLKPFSDSAVNDLPVLYSENDYFIPGNPEYYPIISHPHFPVTLQGFP
jgi:CheY-like chemotaxis protein